MASFAFDPAATVALVGPTSSGKSSLATLLAKTFNGEVVNMDSMQVYRELRVGTSRPSEAEMAEVPHHLYGFVAVKQPLGCIAFAELARKACADIQSRGKLPILVGGTGLYMRAIFEGTAQMPATPLPLRLRLVHSCERHGLAWMYRLLIRLDPEGAKRLHPNDRQRIMRFLEVRILSGKSILEHWREAGGELGLKLPIAIGLEVERGLLWRRITATVGRMLESGWLEEAQELRRAGLEEEVRHCGALGYGLVFDYLDQRLTRTELLERISIGTRQYAKRQMTWFRRVTYLQWFPFAEETGYNTESIFSFIRSRNQTVSDP